jgi:predicted TIM-barrel fold metal-dependent hydrolase
MIIDAHTHVWPDRIAPLALVSNPVPGLTARGDGTVAGLEKSMTSTGVGLSCCLTIANEARLVDKVNAFAASLEGQNRAVFGTVHVDLSIEENLLSLRRHGIRAVKIHPLFQSFALNDLRLWELFDALDDDFVVIAHVGEGGDAFTNSLSNPAMVAAIAHQFPRLRFVACHFGGYKLFDQAEEVLGGVDVVLETSWPPALATLRPERVAALIRRHGAERVVFGSDWPMTDPRTEISTIERLGLGDGDTKLVLGGTMARLLGIESSWSS